MMSEVMHWDGNLPLEIRDRSNKLVARLMVHSEREDFGHVQGIVCVYDGYSERVIDQTGFGGYDRGTGEPEFDLGLDDKGGRTKNLRGFPSPSEMKEQKDHLNSMKMKLMDINLERQLKEVAVLNNDEIPF